MSQYNNDYPPEPRRNIPVRNYSEESARARSKEPNAKNHDLRMTIESQARMIEKLLQKVKRLK